MINVENPWPIFERVIRTYLKNEYVPYIVAELSGSTEIESELAWYEKISADAYSVAEFKESLRSLYSKTEQLYLSEAKKMSISHEGDDAQVGKDSIYLSKGGEKGGIDLNSESMGLEIKNNGVPINVDFDPAMLESFKKSAGFAPVVIDLHPLSSVRMFLGLHDQEFFP